MHVVTRTLAGLAIASLVVPACGCGSSSTTAEERAAPRTVDLRWHETFRGRSGLELRFEVRRLTVRRHGWTVAASVENHSLIPIAIGRPHMPGGTLFGLVVLQSSGTSELRRQIRRGALGPPLTAARFEPFRPVSLGPGQRWAGTFSGPQTLLAGKYVRVSFGAFSAYAAGVAVFQWITDHAVRL
jgi:hypothetical protein